jgi:membrane protease YdiL (CAAX protease family)
MILNIFSSAFLATVIIEKFRTGHKFRTIGFNADKWMIKEIGTALILVGMSNLFFYLIAFLLRSKIEYYQLTNLNLIIGQSAIIFIIATTEELFFRGIVFQAILSRFGPFITIVVSSIIFSVLHIANNGFSLIPFMNTILANLLLCEMYILSKSLWMPVSWHFLWNWGQAFILGCPVSGYLYGYSFMNIHAEQLPSIWFGDIYGIEGGLIVTMILILSIIAVLKFIVPSPYIAALNFKRDYEESSLLF